jgi:hypothetical protein
VAQKLRRLPPFSPEEIVVTPQQIDLVQSSFKKVAPIVETYTALAGVMTAA